MGSEAARSVVVEDLVRVLQDRVNHTHLPAGVRDVSLGAGTHQRWAEHNSQILAVHPAGSRVLHHAVEMQRQSTQSSIVGIR